MELADRVAIVTGAGRGLGRSIAEMCFREGARVALWDIDRESVEDLAGALDLSGERAIAVVADVTDEAAIGDAAARVVDKFGRIDILVNNAGISLHRPIEDMSLEVFEQVIRVDLTGMFICCKAVTPIMKRQRGGKIVNIASLSGRTGRAGVGVNYGAAKAGVIGLTQTLARELGPFGIYVNSVCPGPILTDQTRRYPREIFASWNVGRAIDRDGLPEDVANAVVFLASDRSNWITGATLDINGGILMR